MPEDLDGILTDILGEERYPEKEEGEEEALKKAGKLKMDKYPALQIISKIYKICGYICGGATLLLIAMTLFTIIGGRQVVELLKYALQVFIVGGIATLTCLASSEGIKLFIRIEINTRKQTHLLTQLLEKQKN